MSNIFFVPLSLPLSLSLSLSAFSDFPKLDLLNSEDFSKNKYYTYNSAFDNERYLSIPCTNLITELEDTYTSI